ncbi:hypothetical protein CVIRNUC_005298 [Coccomyxa viridis]|uniref:Histone deacetylase domain-containing protein n=1 Tax=Coccomyxa viridis TaxID=1274662 RepID=A0AAV1I7T9_9CHLO|nr:hypothetical protein CVIRNUC_005298 [Coccomyxa viridis]
MGRCSRPDTAKAIQPHYKQLIGNLGAQALPIVYSDVYNIGFLGIERMHPFDSRKFGKVMRALQNEGFFNAEQLVAPTEATQEMLLDVHTQEYLDSINSSPAQIASICELGALGVLPNAVVQRNLNRPMRLHVAGTMLAVGLALEHGWSINLGGGMHHASYDTGGGWCVYDDWTLALRMLRRASQGRVQKALMIDLDVHQGNGHERDKLHFQDDDLYIFDMYNCQLWPADSKAKAAIDCDKPIVSGTGDAEYLARLAEGLAASFSKFSPDIVLYNAGTDILVGDPLGACKVSAEAVCKRDEMVFSAVLESGVPICMALSGGYAKDSAKVITQCLSHLFNKFQLIQKSSKL